MREGWNGLDLGKSLQAEVEAIASELPLGMSFTQVTDQSVNITQAVDQFMRTFLEALAIVMIVSLIGARLAGRHRRRGGGAADAGDRARDHVGDRARARPDHAGLADPRARPARRRRDHRHRNDGREDGRGLRPRQGVGLCLEPHAAPMLAGTLVTVIGLMPVGFARSTAGEYAGNIFWIVGFALLASWVVAVVFTPYLGVKLLPRSSRSRAATRRSTKHRATTNCAG